MGRTRKMLLLVLAAAAVLVAAIAVVQADQSGNALCINELVASSSITSGEQGIEWIELYNGTDTAIPMGGYGISDDPDDPYQYVLPNVSIDAKGYLLLCTDPSADSQFDEALPLPFRLRSTGGYLFLTAPDGTTADWIEYQDCYKDISWGRAFDGGAVALLNEATPGYSNAASLISRYEMEINQEKPTFSHLGGFYDEPFDLTISCPEGCTVFYTTDGSLPTLSSTCYTGPIHIEDISSQPNRYAQIPASAYPWFVEKYGVEPVTKGTVIRARICRDGILSEYTEDATYFVGVKPNTTTVSLITDPDNLFGYENGIYTAGALGKWCLVTKQTDRMNNWQLFGNYLQRGKDAMRPANCEIFSEGNGYHVDGQSIEMQIQGGRYGGVEECKPLRLTATSRYGDSNTFDVDFSYTDDDPPYTKQLILRAQKSFVEGILDDVIGSVGFLGDGLYVQSFEPVTVYLNGEYWGIAGMRERITAKGIAERYGLDLQDMTLLKYSDWELYPQRGDASDVQDYMDLMTYPNSHDMTLDESYQYLADRIDLNGFIRLWMAHIFFASCDWPDNNVRVFKVHQPDPDNPWADGRWHFVLFDMDMSCRDSSHNTLLYAMGEIKERTSYWAGPGEFADWYVSLFRGLMQNATFRKQFLDVYLEYRADLFQPATLHQLLDDVLAAYGSEMEHHTERWTPTPNLVGKLLGRSEENTEDMEDIANMRTFMDERLDILDGYMEEYYGRYGETVPWSGET